MALSLVEGEVGVDAVVEGGVASAVGTDDEDEAGRDGADDATGNAACISSGDTTISYILFTILPCRRGWPSNCSWLRW